MNVSQSRLSMVAKHVAATSTSVRAASTTATKASPPPTFREKSHYKYFLPIQTRWTDNDQYGHINNSIYYHYIDTVVNEYLIRNCGLDPTDKSNTKPIGLVVSSSANFYSSASYPSVLDVGLSISKIGRSSVTYRVGIFEKDSSSKQELACVVGGFTHVFVHPETRRPVALPEQFKSEIEKLLVVVD
ncbi:HotDog domain-containing protein [Cunninghamella echinulata]|nr:HotDog domain-containing protein [Cunninghamella echinulata]